MIEFITRHADDISFWLMFAIAICSNILLHFQRKAYRKLDEKHLKLLINLLDKETELLSIIHAVEDFIEEHNSWHDRKICLYYNKDGWHCCYVDEIPQCDIFTDQEEITQENEKEDENQQSI